MLGLLLNIMAIFLSVGVLIYLITTTYSNLYSNFKKFHNHSPVIGYKQAKLNIYSIDNKNHIINLDFSPVNDNAKKYLINDKAIGRGFHSYSNFIDAKNHEQYGNVILEVIPYGKVTKWEKGYISSDQKVLQIIVDRGPSKGFHEFEYDQLFLNDWTDRNGNNIIFSCIEDTEFKASNFAKKYRFSKFIPTNILNENTPLLSKTAK